MCVIVTMHYIGSVVWSSLHCSYVYVAIPVAYTGGNVSNVTFSYVHMPIYVLELLIKPLHACSYMHAIGSL